MKESTLILDHGAIAQGQCKSSLEAILGDGSRRLLQEALELEVQQYVERFQQLKNESGQSLVVRNGYHQERELVTGAGKVPVRQPRVHDRRPDEHFTSAILPWRPTNASSASTWTNTQAERHWHRLNSHRLITNLVDGDTFTDGELKLKEAA